MTIYSRTKNHRSSAATNANGDDEVIVAIDVETTGTDPARDRIIEVAAVKFRIPRLQPGIAGSARSTSDAPHGVQTIDQFNTLVNPQRELLPFIIGLTGITQKEVDAAPAFDQIAARLRELIGGHAVAGHNVSFDTGFLRSHGVQVNGPAYDTYDMAFILLTDETEYRLESLANRFNLRQGRAHRALSDTLATRDLFVLLNERLANLDPAVLNRLLEISPSASWPMGLLAKRVLAGSSQRRRPSSVGPLGLDMASVGPRARAAWSSRVQRPGSADVDRFKAAIASAFGAGGQIEQYMPGYERRPQQEQMAAEIASAIAGREHAVIEAGTGVGKTLAYLVPAALHSASGGGVVIVSTNTINLQEQLLGKDLPVAKSVLERLEKPVAGLRAVQLKGRANYLCFRKWAHAVQADAPTESDARVLSKCLLWLQHTETGDRSELGLGRDTAAFTRLSAQGAASCPPQDTPCFLRKARDEARGADIIVINHSLLLSDMAVGGGLLPPHDTLIIDEAHHLEAVATRHLGFQVTESLLTAELTSLQGERGLIAGLARTNQALAKTEALSAVPAAAAQATACATQAVDRTGFLFNTLRRVAKELTAPGEEGADLRITPGVRKQRSWEELELAWENMDGPLSELIRSLRQLISQVESAAPESEDAAAVLLNANTAFETLTKARDGLKRAVTEPDEDTVYWVSSADRREWTTVNGAPLRVGPILQEKLFEREPCVVLIGATLSDPVPEPAQGVGRFLRLRGAVGLEGGRELVLGSPFDYRRSALVVVPEDMPEPGSPGYANAVAAAIQGISLALRDRVLALFTSNAALETARRSIAPALQAEGIRVIAQGTDGNPHRVMRALAETPAAVAMGAQSLWEGVDLGAAGPARSVENGPVGAAGRSRPDSVSIKALIMARLPFPVPTDPIVAARSELYGEDGFNGYMVPEAVLRFRQGFGRLIRSRSDRGAFVILDRRILTKPYGLAFQRALPKCTVRRVSMTDLAGAVRDWNKGVDLSH